MRHPSSRPGWAVTLSALVLTLQAAPAAAQKAFPSADDAVSALVAAAQDGERAAINAVFGPKADQVILSGDAIADGEARALFAARAAERKHLEFIGDDFAVLSVGNDDWPFAIPLMKDARGWRFDLAAGKTELLNRRIGRNELFTIQICQEYVGAQRDYARRRRATDGILEYAQRLRSTPGRRDGLYWETQDGDAESPMGPLFAFASQGGYRPGMHGTPQPFHGYLYRQLTAAGAHAPGGARPYVRDGRMTGGFALVAYPVRYGVSGVKTFIVNEQGIVFEQDLGPRTTDVAAGMTAYDPDGAWDPAE